MLEVVSSADISEATLKLVRSRVKQAACLRRLRDAKRDKGECGYCSRWVLAQGRCMVCLLKKYAYEALGSTTRYRELVSLFIRQRGRCFFSGVPLLIGTNASVDHILPSRHYPHLRHDASNLCWVDVRVNFAKRDMLPGDFLAMCRAVARKSNEA